MSGRPNGV